MHECQEIRSANINQKEDRFLIYERDLVSAKPCQSAFKYLKCIILARIKNLNW